MREITITKREEGQRLDRFLQKYMPAASSGFLHKMLRKKNIKKNGAKAEGGERLAAGDVLEIYFSEETFEKFGAAARKAEAPSPRVLSDRDRRLRARVKLLYSSENVLIFDKPAGMLSQKAKPEDDSLNDYLTDFCVETGRISAERLAVFRPSVGNRLDRNTSGLVLCGVSVRGLQQLSALLARRNVKKYYLAVVSGRVEEGARLAGYLKKDEAANEVHFQTKKEEGAAPVETWFSPLSVGQDATLLKVRLVTGKSHQIRAHLAAVGHPVLGDYKYGDRRENDRLRARAGVARQLLHSYELCFPKEGEGPEELCGKRIRCVPPKDFAKACAMYGLALPGEGEGA